MSQDSPQNVFFGADECSPVHLNLAAGKHETCLMDDKGVRTYDFAITNGGRVVVRCQQTGRAVVFTPEDLVALAITKGIGEVSR